MSYYSQLGYLLIFKKIAFKNIWYQIYCKPMILFSFKVGLGSTDAYVITDTWEGGWDRKALLVC